ncbi:MAG: PAS domain S-box protein [Candidatus Hinthialibacter antarcticus]|nr:PAS domain S-box protein [Candidatus Hinthialibacter antarcticus]
MFFTILPVLTASQQFKKRYYLIGLAISIVLCLIIFYYQSSNFWRSTETLIIVSICLVLISESFFSISQRFRKTVQDLEESQAMLKSVVRAAPVGIGSVNNRVINWSNERLSEMLGYSKSELHNHNARFLYPSEEEYIRVGAIKHPQVENHGIGTVETQWKRKDGSIFDLLLSSSALNPANLSDGMVFTALDISEFKSALQQNAMLVKAIEHAAESVLITNTDGEIQYVNEAFETTTGYSKNEALGQTPHILYSDKHSDEFHENIWNTLRNGQMWKDRIFSKRKDGKTFPCDLTVSPVFDDNHAMVSFVAVMRDATRETELEGQLLQAQKLEAIGQLAGGVAHDFNNLMLVVTGYGELAKERLDKDHPIQSDLDQIIHAGEQAAAVTRQLLAFSRKEMIQPKEFNLNELLQQSEKMLKRFWGETVLLHLYLEPDLGLITFDPSQMEQIVLNLTLNARDAMPKGGAITIETTNIVLDESYAKRKFNIEPGAYILLSISDTGSGIDSQSLPHIFEPFFTTKNPEKGTGLGLSTVYGVVKQNHGHISVYSELEKGTIFKLYFKRSNHIAEPTQAASTIPEIKRGCETILLVEDDSAACEFIFETLKENGYNVIAARQSDEAIEAFQTSEIRIDLLLSDVVLPYMSGRELADALLLKQPDLPVLFISGYTANAVVHNGTVNEGVHLLQKPFTPLQLNKAVRERLDSR